MSVSTLWRDLLQRYPPTTIEFFGTSIIQLVCFWFVSAFYIALPYLFPAFSARHKLQKQEKQPTFAEIWECFLVVFRNQVFSICLQLGISLLHTKLGRPPSHRFDLTLPGPAEVARDIILSILLREILFYYIHRLLHHPSIYPTIHKPHHRFTAPVALAAQHATVTEHLFANIIPVSLPPIILKCHVVTFWAFLILELLQTTMVHSGYDFFAGLARMHDLHHEKFVVCFGTVGLLDWLHKTGGEHGPDGKEKAKTKTQ
jgi:sterol desaturase/sphingolipid hydroxylase (fatty acid hydroxylase superfamily)